MCKHPNIVQKKLMQICSLHLEESLVLELGDPRLRAVLRHVVLVVLVTHEADKLAIAFRLGAFMIISISGCGTHHLAAGCREEIIELTCSVAVRRLITTSEDGHVLAVQV